YKRPPRVGSEEVGPGSGPSPVLPAARQGGSAGSEVGQRVEPQLEPDGLAGGGAPGSPPAGELLDQVQTPAAVVVVRGGAQPGHGLRAVVHLAQQGSIPQQSNADRPVGVEQRVGNQFAGKQFCRLAELSEPP